MAQRKRVEVSFDDMLGELGLEDDEEEYVAAKQTTFQSLRRKTQSDDIFLPEESAGQAEAQEDGGDDAQFIEEDQTEDNQYEEGEADGEGDYQAERAARERTSGFANDEAGPMDGQNPRMFYAIRNMNRSEEDLFLDVYEKWCYQQVPRIDFSRQHHPFVALLQNHPHPKFLNIPLCVATNSFYNESTRIYEWNSSTYERKYKDIHAQHDILRYIDMFIMYS